MRSLGGSPLRAGLRKRRGGVGSPLRHSAVVTVITAVVVAGATALPTVIRLGSGTMAKRPKAAQNGEVSAAAGTADVPVVGLREPCPCGSGRRYKACHGRAVADRGARRVLRPFEGLASECDLVALRNFVPAATAPMRLVADPDRVITLATVLPMAWPAVVRDNGDILLALQTQVGSGDASRDLGDALERALLAEPGTAVPPIGLPADGARLQDLIVDEPFAISVYEGFDFWMPDPDAEHTDDIKASLERAKATAVPTQRLSAPTGAAYWCSVGTKEHVRWVLPYDEDRALTAMARVHAAGEDTLGPDTRFVGSFRADGRLVPVWDLPVGRGAQACEAPLTAYAARLASAMDATEPLTPAERSALAGLRTRQVSLR